MSQIVKVVPNSLILSGMSDIYRFSITEKVITEDKIVENVENFVEDTKDLEVMYDGVVVEKDFECVQDDDTKKFLCKQCKYYSTYYGNIKQHYKTKKY